MRIRTTVILMVILALFSAASIAQISGQPMDPTRNQQPANSGVPIVFGAPVENRSGVPVGQSGVNYSDRPMGTKVLFGGCQDRESRIATLENEWRKTDRIARSASAGAKAARKKANSLAIQVIDMRKKLAKEVKTRKEEITRLDGRIDDETQVRYDADMRFSDNLETEKKERIQADKGLDQNLRYLGCTALIVALGLIAVVVINSTNNKED